MVANSGQLRDSGCYGIISSMKVIDVEIAGLKIIEPDVFGDSPDFAISFFEKCCLSQYSRGSREKTAIILYDYISERLDG